MINKSLQKKVLEYSIYHHNLNTETGLSSTFKKQETPESIGLTGKLSFTEQPTVTYLPLHGNDFIQRLLKPISVDIILLLANKF